MRTVYIIAFAMLWYINLTAQTNQSEKLVTTTQYEAHHNFQNITDSVEEGWVNIYNGPTNGTDQGTGIAIDALGNVYVAGGSGNDFITIKYKPTTGDTLWTKSYDGPANGTDGAAAIAIDNTGNVYVTGQSQGTGTNYDYATIKYSATGNEEWVARYNGPGNGVDRAWAITTDDSGYIYITGQSRGSGTLNDYCTIKYNTNGDTMWVARYNGPGNGADVAYGVAVDGAGNVYVTGKSTGTGTDFDYATLKYNVSGELQWVARNNGPGNSSDAAQAIVVDNTGNSYVTGANVGAGTDSDFVTIKYNTSGTEEWISRYNGPGNGDDNGYAIAIDDIGNVYATGTSINLNGFQAYTTIKYNAVTGDTMWVARHESPYSGYNYTSAISIDKAENVYVTGISPDVAEATYAMTTIKYNTSGTQEWLAYFSGTGGGLLDQGLGVVVDGTGNVYVTGWAYNAGTSWDLVTIKYRQLAIPNSPTNLFAVADTFFVDLSWDDNSDNELGFKIERKDDSLHTPGPWTLVDSVGENVNTFTDTGLVPNTVYSYRVYAYNTAGNSASDSVETVTVVPVELTSFTAIVNGNGVNLSWSTATETNNKGFEVEKQISNPQSSVNKWESIAFIEGNGTTTLNHTYTFTDKNTLTGKYLYRLKQLDFNGSYMYSKGVEVEISQPKEFSLSQNYPNPFNPATTIEYTIPEDGFVMLKVYNALGQEVTRLVNGNAKAGIHHVTFDASNLTSGVYFYSVQSNNETIVKKMMVLK